MKKKTIEAVTKNPCPVGLHWVCGYWRQNKKGTKSWVEPHLAHNPKRENNTLTASEIKRIYHQNLNKCYIPLVDIIGFKGQNEYDQLIMFWVEYWQGKGFNFPQDFSPLMIKSLIAQESSFNPLARSKASNSTATGLMQVTKTALSVLSAKPDSKGYIEVKKYFIKVTQNDLLDPNTNIAVGIRWLLHKFSRSSKKSKDSTYMFKLYHSNDKEGDAYAEKVMALYKESIK